MKNKTIELSPDTLKSLAAAMGTSIIPAVIEVPSEPSPFLGQVVVVRTYSAGIHIGTLVAKTGTNVLLADAVRLWKWTEAFTLSEVANMGVGKASKIATMVDHIELTQAIEIIGTTPAARLTYGERNHG